MLAFAVTVPQSSSISIPRPLPRHFMWSSSGVELSYACAYAGTIVMGVGEAEDARLDAPDALEAADVPLVCLASPP